MIKSTVIPAEIDKMVERRGLARLDCDESIAVAMDEEQNDLDDSLQPARLSISAGIAVKPTEPIANH